MICFKEMMGFVKKSQLEELTEIFQRGHLSDSELTSHQHSMSREELWQDLCENVSWLSAARPSREFAQIRGDTKLRRRDVFPSGTSPFLLADTRRVARSYARMQTAEEISMSFVQSLRPWGAICCDRVVWHFIDKPFLNVAYLGGPFDFAIDTVWESINRNDHKCPSVTANSAKVPALLRKTMEANDGWECAVRANAEITGPRYAIPESNWQSFGRIDNPFSILLALWKQECFIFNIPTSENPQLSLYMRR